MHDLSRPKARPPVLSGSQDRFVDSSETWEGDQLRTRHTYASFKARNGQVDNGSLLAVVYHTQTRTCGCTEYLLAVTVQRVTAGGSMLSSSDRAYWRAGA